MAPLWLSFVLILPWLPVSLPSSVFIWTGWLRLWLWAAIAVALLAPSARGFVQAFNFARLSPRRSAAAAGLVAALAYGGAAWIDAAQHPGGDEPHYLVIAQSLIKDHDLQIENNYQQRDYASYYHGSLKPDFLLRGVNGPIYSIHAPGLPLLVAPALAAFGYPGVLLELIAVSAAGSALAWLVAWRVTRDRWSSWFGWAATSFSAPLFFHASAIYPDGLGAFLVLTATLPLIDRRARTVPSLLAVGLALAVLPWLHTRFAVLAAAAGVTIAVRIGTDSVDRLRRVTALAVLPLLSVVAWLAYFHVVYGTFSPSAPYGSTENENVANIVRGIPGLLFDQQYGVFATAPVLICACLGFAALVRSGSKRLALELLAITVPYFVIVAAFYMWWGGLSAPARFLVPLIFVLSMPSASWFSTRHTTVPRLVGGLTLYLTIAATATMSLAEHGRLSINFRDGASRMLTWLTPVVDLTTALPSLFRGSPVAALGHTAIWVAAAAIAWVAALVADRSLNRHRAGSSSNAVTFLAAGLAAEFALMGAVSLTWRANNALPWRPDAAAWPLLRQYEPESRQLAFSYRPFRRLDLRDVPGRTSLTHLESAADNDWANMIGVPPGTYEVSGRLAGAGHGVVRLVMNSESQPVAEWPVASLDPVWSRRFTLPVAVPALGFDLDQDARRAVHELAVTAVSILPRRERLPDDPKAVRFGRYGPVTMFLLSGSAWTEPLGIWVGGQRSAEFAVHVDGSAPLRLLVRNGTAPNRASLENGRWHETVPLTPSEERMLDIPLSAAHSTTRLRIQSASGFYPADVESGSRDRRYLGLWVETR